MLLRVLESVWPTNLFYSLMMSITTPPPSKALELGLQFEIPRVRFSESIMPMLIKGLGKQSNRLGQQMTQWHIRSWSKRIWLQSRISQRLKGLGKEVIVWLGFGELDQQKDLVKYGDVRSSGTDGRMDTDTKDGEVHGGCKVRPQCMCCALT